MGKLLNIREFIQVRNHRNMKNMGRSLELIELFLTIREFILMIIFMNVRNVGQLLLCVDKSLNPENSYW